jgi:MerR family transcriptional regulator, copper efflux regulator
MKSSEMTIGELAAHFRLATHVLRHWEAVGLLTPARRVNGRRRYGPEHRTRVAIIVHGKQVGLSLAQLHELLSVGGGGRRAVLAAHHRDLERRIADATAAKILVEHALDCDQPDFLDCPRFQQLVHEYACRDVENRAPASTS